jgi:hypothetical protein
MGGGKMLIITNKRGEYVPGMGGDPRLFTQADALSFIRDRLANNPNWTDNGAMIEQYIPNVMHLDAIEFLRDKGFLISLDSDGDRIVVDCDTLWSTPMVDLLHDTLQNGEHHVNRDHNFKIKFGQSKMVNIAFQEHSLSFPIYFDFGGKQYIPSIWKLGNDVICSLGVEK